MKKIIKILVIIILGHFLYSCGSFSDAGKVLRNEKNNNTDEFLVKKRDPLVLPPDYNTLPVPGSQKTSTKNNKDKIDKILKIPKESSSKQKKSSSVEQSILNRIGK